jgi:two-component sensor histidine kinase
MPQNVNLWNSRSLGLRLVRILSEQIGAAVEVTGPPGTRIELSFAAKEAVKK